MPIEPNNQGQASSEPLIRTMQKDIDALSGESQPQETAPPIPGIPTEPVPNVPSDEIPSPPTDLPISPEPPATPEPPQEPESNEPTFPETPSLDIPEPPLVEEPEKEAPSNIPLDQLSTDQAETEATPMPTFPESESDVQEKQEGAEDKTEKIDEVGEDEIERRRRSEQEEIAPKDFTEEMVKDSTTLEEQRKKVEKLATEKPKGNRLKIVVIGIAIVTLILVVGGFLYWWNYIRVVPTSPETHLACQGTQCVEVEGAGSDQCQDSSDCTSTIQPPVSLIYIDQTETIELGQDQTDLVYNRIKSSAANAQSPSTIKRILIKIIGQETKYLTLDELIQALGITLPFTNGAASDYTLFIYSQPEGNRLGLVINTAIAGMSGQELKDLIRSQEPAMANTLRPLFLDGLNQVPSSPDFLDNTYKDVAIRYLNFPDPSLTYDYAVVGNKFILTTSKDSIYAVIDKLADTTPEPLAEESGFKEPTEEELKEAKAKEDVANIKASLAQLRSVAEMLYDAESDYSSLCKDGELNEEVPEQGENLTTIKQKITEHNENKTIECYASKTSYCVKTNLSTNEMQCVDSGNNPMTIENEMCTAEKIYCVEK